EAVDIPAEVAEISLKLGRVSIPAAKHEAAIGSQSRNRDQSPAREIHSDRHVSVECRRDEPAVLLVGPAVIGAHEPSGIARVGAAKLCATMPATVEHRLDARIAIADDND